MTIEFQPFPKIPRLKRGCVVTEKIDGTNAAVRIIPLPVGVDAPYCAIVGEFAIFAQSRSKFITPGDDNYGFARWVAENAPALVSLGEGAHFGEWWGAGIQRRYGLTEKRFSLFNVGRWNADNLPSCCHLVPVLYQGDFDTQAIDESLSALAAGGSVAAPGFMRPEGIIVCHVQSRSLFKRTLEHDEAGKDHGA